MLALPLAMRKRLGWVSPVERESALAGVPGRLFEVLDDCAVGIAELLEDVGQRLEQLRPPVQGNLQAQRLEFSEVAGVEEVFVLGAKQAGELVRVLREPLDQVAQSCLLRIEFLDVFCELSEIALRVLRRELEHECHENFDREGASRLAAQVRERLPTDGRIKLADDPVDLLDTLSLLSEALAIHGARVQRTCRTRPKPELLPTRPSATAPR